MRLFTEQDLEWIKARGFNQREDMEEVPGVDFYQGDIGNLHVQVRKFEDNSPGQYEMIIMDSYTKEWAIGRGDSIQNVFNQAVSHLEKRKSGIETLINAVKKL